MAYTKTLPEELDEELELEEELDEELEEELELDELLLEDELLDELDEEELELEVDELVDELEVDELDEELEEELLLDELESTGSVTPPHATSAEAHTNALPNFRARQSSGSDRILSIVIFLFIVITWKNSKADRCTAPHIHTTFNP